jgi:hypothetical protein
MFPHWFSLPQIVRDLRRFNRYVVQKRARTSTHRGRPKKKNLEPVTPELIDALPIDDSRLSAALTLSRFYKEVA